jgi:hypothetical protein
VKIRVRHSYDFGPDRGAVGGTLLDPSAWDAARSLAGPFGLPETREEWERSAVRGDLEARARDVVLLARQLDAARVCSHGVGTASLELNVHRAAPDLRLVCTDYAPRTVERLRRLFPEAEVVERDLTDPDPPPADLHLMHRIDAELGDDEWRSVFEAIDEPILFVPNVVLDLPGAAREVGRRLLRRGSLTDAGWFRNEPALRSLWSDTHRDRPVAISDARAFLLERR